MLSDADREKLENLQFQFGPEAGSLALALELLTDAMAMVNLHAVYCRIGKGPHTGQPPMDVRELLATLEKAKRLVQDALGPLNKAFTA